MNIDQIIWPLVEKLRGTSIQSDERDEAGFKLAAVQEIALLSFWKIISDKDKNKQIPKLDNVINGTLDLLTAYENLSSLLDTKFEWYLNSSLPHALSNNEIVSILCEIEKISPDGHQYIINQLMSLSDKNGNPIWDLSIPIEISNLMVGLAKINKGSVLAPYTRSLQLAIQANENADSVISQIEKRTAISDVISYANDIEVFDADLGMIPFFEKKSIRQFDHILMIPPFGRIGARQYDGKIKKNSDIENLELMLPQCSGRMIVLMTEGFLFRSAHDYELRVKLINEGWLDAVIQLPSPILFSTSIATSILVIDKTRSKDQEIVFYNANDEDLVTNPGRGKANILTGWETILNEVLEKQDTKYCKKVTSEDIKNNKYDLLVSKYVLGKASREIKTLINTKPLQAVAELIRGQLLKGNTETSGNEFLEVGIRDIRDDGFIRPPSKSLYLSGKAQDRALLQRLQPGDILLMVKGAVGKVAVVGNDCSDNWVASQSLQVIRLKNSQLIGSEDYLYSYLSSPLVQAYLSEQITGTTVPVLKTADIKGLPVPIVSKEEQQSVIETRKQIIESYSKINRIKRQIDTLRESHWALSK